MIRRCGVGFLLASWCESADLCSEKRELTEFGTLVKETAQVTSNSPLDSIQRDNARYIRLRLRVQAQGQCTWKLVIRDEDFRPVQLLKPGDFQQHGSLWSARVYGSKAHLDLLDCPAGPGRGPDIRTDEHVWLPATAENPMYSTKTKNPDWQPLGGSGVAKSQMRQGDSVGMLLASTTSRTRNWTCSGFLVSPDLFLTNWHCIEPLPNQEAEAMQGLIVDMSWDGNSASDDYQVMSLQAGSPELDFAFLNVAPLGRFTVARPAVLRKASPATDEVAVIHHPLGLQKMISTSGCRVIALNYPAKDSPALSHTCDTSGGSSGAPLFDGNGRAMALHFCGFKEAQDTQGFNRAVRIDRILAWLAKSTDPKAAQVLARIKVE